MGLCYLNCSRQALFRGIFTLTHAPSHPQDATPISDIDRYFDTPVVLWDGNEDPNWVLSWWNTHANEYPQMSQVARDYLAISVSEVDVERAFSAGRDLLGIRRKSMKPHTMRAIMILKHEMNNR